MIPKRKRFLPAVGVVILCVGLTVGCGSDSKTQKVIQQQMEQAGEKTTSESGSGVEKKSSEKAMSNLPLQNPGGSGANSGTGTTGNRAGTGNGAGNGSGGSAAAADSGLSVDLTQLSSTMVYSEVMNMVNNPDQYLGKKVKMAGYFSVYTDEKSQKNYYACVVSDATACCQQGLEFELRGNPTYPDDYPQVNSLIIVTGIFQVYEEEGNRYCKLIDAEISR